MTLYVNIFRKDDGKLIAENIHKTWEDAVQDVIDSKNDHYYVDIQKGIKGKFHYVETLTSATSIQITEDDMCEVSQTYRNQLAYEAKCAAQKQRNE